MKEIKAYQTEDGVIFKTLFGAQEHITNIELEKFYNNLLESTHESDKEIIKLTSKELLKDFIDYNSFEFVEMYLKFTIINDPRSWIEDLEKLLQLATRLVMEEDLDLMEEEHKEGLI